MSVMQISDVIRWIMEIGDSYEPITRGRYTIQRDEDDSPTTNYYHITSDGKKESVLIGVNKIYGNIIYNEVHNSVASFVKELEDIGIVDNVFAPFAEMASKYDNYSKEPMEEPQALISDARELLANQQREKIINPMWKSTKESITPKDNVNNPPHYNQGKIECIEAMEAMLSPEEFRGFLRGSIFKYQWRVMNKNGVEDLEKAKWYLEKLLEKLEEK